jgi:hypothetical protein
MKFPWEIYVVFVHLIPLVDHNHLMNDNKLNFFVFVQDDKKHRTMRMRHHFYFVLISPKKNFFHISNTKKKISWTKKCGRGFELTLTIFAFFNVLFCSITCLILSQFSTCHKRISQSLIQQKSKFNFNQSLTFDTDIIHLLSLVKQTSLIQSRCP